MTKQIKLGFDKIPVPATTGLQQLYDLNSGLGLQTAEGAPLYTDVESSVSGFGDSKNAASLNVNNTSLDPVKTVEQFPETSQVSSSLLGVPRQERQLSLFADVSTYGLDPTYWEYFNYNSGPGYQPVEWTTRKNKIYGNRYFTRLDEVSNEQALAITAFPVQWTFPFGPNFDDLGLYNGPSKQNLFLRYQKFIQLGNLLYAQYYTTERQFAEDNFLSPTFATPNGDDVLYNPDLALSDVFAEVEKWTIAWGKLKGGNLIDPAGTVIVFPSGYSDSLPGYTSQSNYYGQLQSKKAFRYQPGRASGFTFGLRVSTDKASISNTLEWGACNDTDAYVFQIKGSTFNIVRRSTIPLPESNLIYMGLTNDDQKLVRVPNPLLTTELYETVFTRDYFNGDPLDGNGKSGYIISFEQVTMWKIEFSWYGAIGVKFYVYTPVGNGDARWIMIHRIIIEDSIGYPCLKDPFFKFRYSILTKDTANVTFPQYIYKYGASYYVDGGDEGTTTNHSYSSNIINVTPGLSKSAIGIRSKDYIKNQQGDEIINQKDIIPTMLTVTSETAAKINVIDCEGCPGFGYYYTPALRNGISGITDTFTVSSGGNRLTYASLPSLINSITSTETTFTVTHNTSNVLQYNVGTYIKITGSDVEGYNGLWKILSSGAGTFTVFSNANLEPAGDAGNISKVFMLEDNLKKIIADGIYSTYITVQTDGSDTAGFARRIGVAAPYSNNEAVKNLDFSKTTAVVLSTGEKVAIQGRTASMRLTGYDNLIVSTFALSKPTINVNFLNPRSTDSRHYAEFFIGITDKTPSLESVDVGNGFEDQLLFNGTAPELTDILYGEWAQFSAGKDRDGYDNSEIDPRYADVFEINPQISQPKGVDTGICSQATFTVSEQIFDATYVTTNPVTSASGHFLIFTSAGLTSLTGLAGGEVGVLVNGFYAGSGVFFVDDKVSAPFRDSNSITKYYITVTGNPNLTSTIAIKLISVTGRYISKSKAFKFDVFPLYVVIGMRDGARINNITIDETDTIDKFSYTPSWMKSSTSSITVVNSGNSTEGINASTGLFQSGGTATPGSPSANFVDRYRLDSAQIDTQLQQPLRPGEIRTSFYVGANETNDFNLNHVFGQDRYVITPGLVNSKATFITAKALNGEPAGDLQINLLTKEQ